MNITQTFYDNMASQYDKLFFDWEATTREQALILERIAANTEKTADNTEENSTEKFDTLGT